MSAKRPVSRVRQVVETHTLHARDPRFDALSGSVNPQLFKQSYGFLADKQRAELDTMRKTAEQARKNRTLPQEEKDRIEEALKRMENREVTRRMKEREQEAIKSWKKEEQDKRAQGKKAFYLKECASSPSLSVSRQSLDEHALTLHLRSGAQPSARSSSSRPSSTSCRPTSASCTRPSTRSAKRRLRRRRRPCPTCVRALVAERRAFCSLLCVQHACPSPVRLAREGGRRHRAI